MRFNKLTEDQEQRIITICKLITDQGIEELECLCDDNLKYIFGAYKDSIEIVVKNQKKEGSAYIDYNDFYTVDYIDFKLEYRRSSDDLS